MIEIKLFKKLVVKGKRIMGKGTGERHSIQFKVLLKYNVPGTHTSKVEIPHSCNSTIRWVKVDH